MKHTKPERDNRSYQLNPNNPAYWETYPERPDEWKELTEEKPSTDEGK